VLIFLLNSPGKNIFLNIGFGLWAFSTMATGFVGGHCWLLGEYMLIGGV